MRIAMIISIIVLSIFLAGCAVKTAPEQNISLQNNSVTYTNTEINNSNEGNITETEPANVNISENITAPNPPPEAENANNTLPETNHTEEVANESTPASQNESVIPPLTPTTNPCEANLVETCIGPPWLPCTGSPVFKLNDKTITFDVKNSLDYNIVLKEAAGYQEEEPWECMTRCNAESAEVSVEEAEFVDIATHPGVASGQNFKLRIKCSGISDYLNQKFELGYTGNDTESVGYFLIDVVG